MPIHEYKDSGVISLDSENASYQLKTDSYGNLLHLYFGKKNLFPMDDQLVIKAHAFSGNPYEAKDEPGISLDILPQEFPTLGTGDFRKTALIVEDENGTQASRLLFKEVRMLEEKEPLHPLPSLKNKDLESQSMEIILEDPVLDLEAVLQYSVFDQLDIFTRSVRITNKSSRKITLKKVMSLGLDFLHGDYDCIYFQGRHAMERKTERKRIDHGIFSIRSSRGSSSHHYNPVCILAKPNTDEKQGDCYGFAFAFSGNFLIEIERDYLDQIRVLMGLDDENFSYPLEPGHSFQSPESIISYSNKGLSALSRNYHRMYEFYGSPDSKKPIQRPVLLNSWEAFYFDFNHDSFINLAKEARDLGMDCIVLDDGWFGQRNDDTSSLGDWFENEEKLGGTIKDLSKEIHDMGLQFGLWIEPEMVNENSILYREHPEWVLSIPGRKPVLSRNQMVLDFANPDVVDHIYDQLSKVLDGSQVDYIKWDMNRSLSDYPNGRKSFDYVMGVYDLIDRLQKRYPQILFEGCAGGGGRFDLGMLYYTPQIWTSDNTDAINRAKIQNGTSFFYPPASMAAHVSASPNHQTGRETSLNTRGAVSMEGVFGYELNLSELSDPEKDQIKDQIKLYRSIEHLIHSGDFYRLSEADNEEYSAWMFADRNQDEAFITILPLQIEPSYAPIYLQLSGLDPDADYTDEFSQKIYHGSNLMNGGLVIPSYKQYEAQQFHLKRLNR